MFCCFGLLGPDIPLYRNFRFPSSSKKTAKERRKRVLTPVGNSARKFPSTGISECPQKSPTEMAKEKFGFASESNRIFSSEISWTRNFRVSIIPEFPSVEIANGYISWRGINTPPLLLPQKNPRQHDFPLSPTPLLTLESSLPSQSLHWIFHII